MNSQLFFILSLLYGAYAFTIDVSNRISNGNIANFSDFPFSVSLQRISTQTPAPVERGHKCGGALITYQHVLTAAYCLYDDVNGVSTTINLTEYRIFSGAASLLDDNNQNRIRNIANFSIYPDYVAPPASVNNIAIITLIEPFLNTTVQPISLPPVDYDPSDFTICQIASWGSLNVTSNAVYNLRFVRKYIYSQTVCEALYSQAPMLANIFPTMLCAASFDVVSSGCTGDIGAALVCNGNLTGIMMQTNRCAISSFPEIYTRVSNFTTWAKSITGGSATLRPEITLLTVFTIALARFINTK